MDVDHPTEERLLHDLAAARKLIADMVPFLHPNVSWRYDAIAEVFYRETGYMAPGKDVPMEMAMHQPDYAALSAGFKTWVQEHLTSLVARSKELLGEDKECS